MNIAILGATSQIARDLTLRLAACDSFAIFLYARRPELVTSWAHAHSLSHRLTIGSFAEFGRQGRYDAIFNFVGVGNPAQAVELGASIVDVTAKFDELALGYVRQREACRYFFLSSGAVYGGNFEAPPTESTLAVVALNSPGPQDWYAFAKLLAECRHRAYQGLPIIDLRVFSYFSHTQNLNARFFISDVLRAVRCKTVLETSSTPMVRDYLHPDDFFRLTQLLLNSQPTNCPIDCYSAAPIDKQSLLEQMKIHLGLKYKLSMAAQGINATGDKSHYYSKYQRAALFGYSPKWDSLACVLSESKKILALHASR